MKSDITYRVDQNRLWNLIGSWCERHTLSPLESGVHESWEGLFFVVFTLPKKAQTCHHLPKKMLWNEMVFFSPQTLLCPSRNWCQATWHNWRAHAEHWKLLESNVWAADFQVKLMILFQSVFQKQWATISGKPLYFLRNNTSLETNEVLRLVWCESTPKERVERILKNTL